MPHMPYEKSKMIDITRDKPIKIAVRVAVPVKDHPKASIEGECWNGRRLSTHEADGEENKIVIVSELWFAV